MISGVPVTSACYVTNVALEVQGYSNESFTGNLSGYSTRFRIS